MRPVLLLLIGCAAAPPTTIRMATKIEQDDWSSANVSAQAQSCTLAGDPAPELRAPLEAYAREHLVAEIEAMGFKGLPVITAGDPRPTSCFTEIRLDARARTGELEVSQCEPSGNGCQWGASITYCLHVTHETGKHVIIIEHHASMLGARAQAPRTGA